MPEVSEICQTVIRKESNERPKGRQGQAPVHFQPKQSVAGGDPVCCGVLARRWGGLVLGWFRLATPWLSHTQVHGER